MFNTPAIHEDRTGQHSYFEVDAPHGRPGSGAIRAEETAKNIADADRLGFQQATDLGFLQAIGKNPRAGRGGWAWTWFD